MKQLFISTLFVFITMSSFAQSKTQFGVYAEGGLFFPDKGADSSSPNKNGPGAGAGFYASTPISGRLSASLGAGYRYKENQRYLTILSDETFLDTEYYSPYKTFWQKFSQHYLTVPLKLRYTTKTNLFVEGGIEASWLLNYNYANEKTEFNWQVGIGSCKYRVGWSLIYIQGFKEQGMGVMSGYQHLGQIYNNRMLFLSLSYTLWN